MGSSGIKRRAAKRSLPHADGPVTPLREAGDYSAYTPWGIADGLVAMVQGLLRRDSRSRRRRRWSVTRTR